MIKYIAYATAVLIVASLAGGIFHFYKVSCKNKKDMAKYENNNVAITKQLGKVLVVYYSLTNKTKEIAEKIKAKTNADIYEIKTVEEIKNNPKIYLTSKQQIKSGKYPEIKEPLPDANDYDVIFVGSPVWWYTAATPVLEFLKKMDFKNKEVIPFSTQGSNFGTFFEDFKNRAKNARIISSESFNNLSKEYDKAVDNKISSWLNSL